MPQPVYPTYVVDGVPLDSTGWYLTPETRRRALPGAKSVNIEIPGRSGQVPVLGLDDETTTLPIGLRVTAARPDGSEGDLFEIEQNLDALYGLFGGWERLLDVRHLPAPGIERQADAIVLASAEPAMDVANRFATLTVVLTIPGVYWRDTTASTWTSPLPRAGQIVSPLSGSTAPITDAVLRYTGPATNPRLTDHVSGGTVAYSGVISAGQRLLVDCGAFRAAVVTADTWDLGAGSDVSGNVDSTGPGSSSRWLRLTPAIVGGDPYSRAVTVTSQASGTTAASKAEIRARRAYR